MGLVYAALLENLKHRHERSRIEARFPFFKDYEGESEEAGRALRPSYEQYVRAVSTPNMALSLKTAVLLEVLLAHLRPQSILDLGSGFSSFVFRSYAKREKGARVWSVDDSDAWLARTEAFLAARALSTEDLITWNEFQNAREYRFDFILHDLGLMAMRSETLPAVLKLGREGGGVVILDDLHKTAYRREVRQAPKDFPCRLFHLSGYTRDEYGRYAGLVTDFAASVGSGDNPKRDSRLPRHLGAQT